MSTENKRKPRTSWPIFTCEVCGNVNKGCFCRACDKRNMDELAAQQRRYEQRRRRVKDGRAKLVQLLRHIYELNDQLDGLAGFVRQEEISHEIRQTLCDIKDVLAGTSIEELLDENAGGDLVEQARIDEIARGLLDDLDI